MLHLRYLLVLMGSSVFALALAGGKPRQIKGWGETIDPEKDSKFTLSDGRLAITVAGAYRDLWADKGKVNAPVVLLDVAGDFTVQVKVMGKDRPEKGTVVPKSPAEGVFQAGCLLIWKDDKNFVRLDRCYVVGNKSGKNATYCYLQAFQNGKRATEKGKLVNVYLELKDQDTLLRLVRRGKSISSAFSQDDGKAWTSLPISSFTMELPENLKVGVGAVNTTIKPFTAEFEGLKVEAK